MEWPGEGNGNLLQYSCLENPMGRGASWDTVHGVKKSQTRLKWLSTQHPMWNRGFPGKESTCNAGDQGSIPGLGRSPGGGHGNPFQYSCLENPHGQRSLAGYSPQGCKESATTAWLTTAQRGTESIPWHRAVFSVWCLSHVTIVKFSQLRCIHKFKRVEDYLCFRFPFIL